MVFGIASLRESDYSDEGRSYGEGAEKLGQKVGLGHGLGRQFFIHSSTRSIVRRVGERPAMRVETNLLS